MNKKKIPVISIPSKGAMDVESEERNYAMSLAFPSVMHLILLCYTVYLLSSDAPSIALIGVSVGLLVFSLYFVFNIQVFAKFLESSGGKAIFAVIITVSIYVSAVIACGYIGAIFGINASALPNTTIFYTYYLILVGITYGTWGVGVFVLAVIFSNTKRYTSKEYLISIGFALNWSMLCYLSPHIVELESEAYPTTRSIAFTADFSRHHCNNISKDLKVLFTGDNNSVLVMGVNGKVGASICEYPENPKF